MKTQLYRTLMDEDLYIPVDDAIREFRRHLLSHPRTILSAKYGDGKSFFLQEFEKDKKVQEKFVLLKLYPVNYQVVENKDIFNLIKYDLLFQLFDKGLLDETQEISSLNLFYTYIRSKDKDIIQFLCEMAAVVGLLPKQFGSIIDKADQLKKKWEQYKDGNGNAELSNFYNRVGGHYLYEADSVTAFIRNVIQQYKEKHIGKQVVLVIEDMDRLDPAHLFRILNVLSAHVDYAYRSGISPDKKSMSGNKFEVDNILLIMDYDNTEHIYRHFYGEEADFQGYINKFISNGYFHYSLSQEKYKYFTKKIAQETQLHEDQVERIVDADMFKGKTIRDVASALHDTQKSLFNVPIYQDINGTMDLPKGVLQLMVIMRRIGEMDRDIVFHFEEVIKREPELMFMCLGGYWLVYRRTFMDKFDIEADQASYIYHVEINGIHQNGYPNIKVDKLKDGSNNAKTQDMGQFIRYMLSFIAN